MSQKIEEQLQKALDSRRTQGSLRRLSTPSAGIDLLSNDYLGFSTRGLVTKEEESSAKRSHQSGATGSRLLSGNSRAYEELEEEIARYHQADSGLIFNSGYDANLGIFSTLPSRHDTILYDEYCHASMRDGIRLSHARSFSFRHNDVEDLRVKLARSRGNIFIGIESVYSMDGDLAPLTEIVSEAQRYEACLVVDEAHATGVFGDGGRGLVSEYHLEDAVAVRMHTFGKALGVHGAVVLGSQVIKEYLLNFSRSFIYTTALPPASIASIHAAYEVLAGSEDLRSDLLRLGEKVSQHLHTTFPQRALANRGAIQGILIPGNERCRRVAESIEKEGFQIKPILSPTVPSGLERLRICLHSFNTTEEIDRFLSVLKDAIRIADMDGREASIL